MATSRGRGRPDERGQDEGERRAGGRGEGARDALEEEREARNAEGADLHEIERGLEPGHFGADHVDELIEEGRELEGHQQDPDGAFGISWDPD